MLTQPNEASLVDVPDIDLWWTDRLLRLNCDEQSKNECDGVVEDFLRTIVR